MLLFSASARSGSVWLCRHRRGAPERSRPLCAGTAISQEQGSHIATGLAAAAVLLVLAVLLYALQGLHASCQRSPGPNSLHDSVTTSRPRLGALYGISMHKGNRSWQPPATLLCIVGSDMLGSDMARRLCQVLQPASVPGSSAGCTCPRRCAKCFVGEDCCCWQTPWPPQPRRACVHSWSNARLSERTGPALIGRLKQGMTQPRGSGAQPG